jgi:hypothetical protein
MRTDETTYIKRLGGEEDDLVELRQVGEEIIDTRSLGGSPSLYSLVCQLFPSQEMAAYIPGR